MPAFLAEGRGQVEGGRSRFARRALDIAPNAHYCLWHLAKMVMAIEQERLTCRSRVARNRMARYTTRAPGFAEERSGGIAPGAHRHRPTRDRQGRAWRPRRLRDPRRPPRSRLQPRGALRSCRCRAGPFARRKQANEPLSAEESDRAVRLARLTAMAERVFGDEEKAHRWLRKPSPMLDGTTRLALLRSETGAQLR